MTTTTSEEAVIADDKTHSVRNDGSLQSSEPDSVSALAERDQAMQKELCDEEIETTSSVIPQNKAVLAAILVDNNKTQSAIDSNPHDRLAEVDLAEKESPQRSFHSIFGSDDSDEEQPSLNARAAVRKVSFKGEDSDLVEDSDRQMVVAERPAGYQIYSLGIFCL